MTIIQKILLAAALAAALTIIIRKALAYERSSRAERAAQIPTLQPVADAKPAQKEPLRAEDLRVAQNAPL
jgi:hypothetical protein